MAPKHPSEEVTVKLDLNALKDEVESDGTTGDDSEEKKVEERSEKKAPRKRKKAQRAESKSKDDDDTSTADQEAAVETAAQTEGDALEEEQGDEVETPKPKRSRKPRAKKVAEDPTPTFGGSALREDVSIATVAMERSMDSMAKQWSSIKGLSETITHNFESVGSKMQEMSNAYAESMKQIADLKTSHMQKKPSTLSKAAIGVSAASLVFSLISFALSQSVRQVVFQPSHVAKTTSRAPIAYKASDIPVPFVEPKTAAPQSRAVIRMKNRNARRR